MIQLPDRSPSSRNYTFLWLSLLLFLVLIIAFLLPVTPQDYWWYLPIGKTIVETRSVPAVDTLSFTVAGQPTFYQSWLAAVIFWVVYKAGGLGLTFLLRGLVLGITYGLLFALLRRLGASVRLAALLSLAAALAGSNNWSMRPQLLAYPFFVLTLHLLYDWLEGNHKRLWMLPLVGLIWSNLHGSYILFYLLGGSALVLGRGSRKALLPWLLAAIGMIFINPRGVLVLQDTVTLLRSPSNQVFSAEWHPPVNAGWQMNLFFAWLLCMIPLAAGSPRKLTLLEWAWLLSFGWLALSGVRYVIWLLFLFAAFTAVWLAAWRADLLGRPGQGGNPAINYLLGAALLLSTLALLPGVREKWWPGAPLAYERVTTPVAATDWLGRHAELPGPMLSDYAFSSYLSFALPSRPVWIDTRFYPFPPEQWQRFQTLAAARTGWQQILREEGINLLVLANVTEPRLIEAARSSSEWCEKYADPDAVIFARCTPLP